MAAVGQVKLQRLQAIPSPTWVLRFIHFFFDYIMLLDWNTAPTAGDVAVLRPLENRTVSEPAAMGSLHHHHPCVLITGLRVCLCEDSESHSWLFHWMNVSND